ncbi:hypothetical protein KQX54_009384 [Cotesia glomerata]|uniref:Uncharacterized protein n=1 Tax=Cotesia glomerata TaxID=32391 RepID=A0AAV7IIN4_COTGL|nr:hypothetical protein KQX54_009384 [Cotesia glomerata]
MRKEIRFEEIFYDPVVGLYVEDSANMDTKPPYVFNNLTIIPPSIITSLSAAWEAMKSPPVGIREQMDTGELIKLTACIYFPNKVDWLLVAKMVAS